MKTLSPCRTKGTVTSRQLQNHKLTVTLGMVTTFFFITVYIFVSNLLAQEEQVERWKGLVVADEYSTKDCLRYSLLRDDYQYSTNSDLVIAQQLGGFYSPYDDIWYDQAGDVDVEHLVARKEAHDSGMCLATSEERYEFAHDLLNLTLATPSVNRTEKRDKDAGEWLPEHNRCWFVYTIIRVKQKYQLTIDERERDAIQGVLNSCSANDIFLEPERPVDDSNDTPP